MKLIWFLLSLGVAIAISSLVAGEPLPAGQSSRVPELVLLDSLSNLYEGVSFDHALHDSYASCVECHHHVAGRPSADPSCSSCHRSESAGSAVDCKSCHLTDRFSADMLSANRNQSRYHIDITGLVGAYHLNCLGCHLSLTAGPTGCLDCHQRKETSRHPRITMEENTRRRTNE